MTNHVKIRLARLSDAATLVLFNLRMAEETEGARLNSDILTSGVQAVLEDPARGFYLVAEVDGKAVGSLMVTTEWSDWRNGVFWWIQSVYVEPELRKRGVFRALYAEVRARAVNAGGVCGCRLYVEKHNAAAQEVYGRQGFIETHYKMLEDLFL